MITAFERNRKQDDRRLKTDVVISILNFCNNNSNILCLYEARVLAVTNTNMKVIILRPIIRSLWTPTKSVNNMAAAQNRK